MKSPKTVGIQYAALPYRRIGRRVDVLLITSRDTKRWVPREVISRIQTCPASMRNGRAAYWMPTVRAAFMGTAAR